MDKHAIIRSLDALQFNLDYLRKLVDETVQPLSKKEASLETSKKNKITTAESLPASQLGFIHDYRSDNWPESVMPHMIVTHRGQAEKQFRALQISRYLGTFTNQTVLDVGCGDGYIAREIANHAKEVVGYDIIMNSEWFTDKMKVGAVLTFVAEREMVEKKDYDAIIMYDVLDHLEGDDPVKFMSWLNSLLNPGGRIIVRTHPWTSKHGGHLYENGPNKAFLHLAMTPDELVQADIDVPPNLRFNRPRAAYEYIFKTAGLKIAECNGHLEPVDSFFTGEILDRIIKITWKGAIDPANALKIMGNSFIDYILTAE